MSEVSARLELPILQPSQAQKHLTHNEALQRLDVLVQAVLLRRLIPTPLLRPPHWAQYGPWAQVRVVFGMVSQGALRTGALTAGNLLHRKPVGVRGINP